MLLWAATHLHLERFLRSARSSSERRRPSPRTRQNGLHAVFRASQPPKMAEMAALRAENVVLQKTMNELHVGLLAGHTQLTDSLRSLVQLSSRSNAEDQELYRAMRVSERHVAAYLSFLAAATEISGSVLSSFAPQQPPPVQPPQVPADATAPSANAQTTAQSAAQPTPKIEWWRRWSTGMPQRVAPHSFSKRTAGASAASTAPSTAPAPAPPAAAVGSVTAIAASSSRE